MDDAATTKADAWLAAFDNALMSGDVAAALALFAHDCYWRDFLSFTWNIKTLEGKAAIAAMLDATLARTSLSGWSLEKAGADKGGVQAWFGFATRDGSGRGIFRLEDGKCRTILTTLQSLTGHEERVGFPRPLGAERVATRGRVNWTERMVAEREALGTTEQPYCLVIGGGQAGIMLGARLRQLGVPTIIAEKNARAGDSWRNRYRSLVLHDPVRYDHLPYMPFPGNWPVFTPKDKMGDWLESYVSAMELNYWGSTEVKSARFNAVRKRWVVDVVRDGHALTLEPAQLVFATGAYGPPNMIALPGAEVFRGEILHSSVYSDGSAYKGKRCAVIGAASSGHDVAVDLWEAGADVTIVQRSPTTVVRSETLMELAFEIYSEQAVAKGIDVDTADMLNMATPLALQPPLQRALYDKIKARDAPFYDDLRGSGFLIDFGPDETGLMMKALRTGSGYYMDVGGSQLIIDGDIKVKSGFDIAALTERGIRFSDDSEIEADIIIQATGFRSLHEVMSQIVSREVGERIGEPGDWDLEHATILDRGTANRAICTSLSRTRICGFMVATSRYRGSSPNLSPYRSRRGWKAWNRLSMVRPSDQSSFRYRSSFDECLNSDVRGRSVGQIHALRCQF
jgi:putative flavoprotein involved in K+ transport